MMRWPSTIPQRPANSTYSEAEGDGRMRTPTEQGPPKMRLMVSYIPEPVTMTFDMTDAQRALFRQFFRDCGKGTKPFEFPDPLHAGFWVMQFGETLPRYTRRGIRWQVALDLVRLP